jgi:hypothetical protein
MWHISKDATSLDSTVSFVVFPIVHIMGSSHSIQPARYDGAMKNGDCRGFVGERYDVRELFSVVLREYVIH